MGDAPPATTKNIIALRPRLARGRAKNLGAGRPGGQREGHSGLSKRLICLPMLLPAALMMLLRWLPTRWRL